MDTLQEGLAAAKAGDRAQARALLMSYVEQNPSSETGWLWLAAVVETPEEAQACLERVLAINPHSQRAKAGLEWARTRAQRAEAVSPEPATPTSPSEPTPSGLLRRLDAREPAPTPPRRVSPYAPTRLFTEADLSRLPGPTTHPAVPEPEPVKPALPEADRLSAWDAWRTEEPVAPALELLPDAEAEGPLEPAPSLGDRLETWTMPSEKPVAPTWEPTPEPLEAEAEEPLGPPPSLADRLGAWDTPTGQEPAAPPTGEPTLEPLEAEAEEPLGPPPSLVDRLGTWAVPSRDVERPAEPEAEPVSMVDLSERLGRLETSLRTPGAPTADAAPSSTTSLTERLRQLRGEPPAVQEEPLRPTETIEELMARGEEALEAGHAEEAETAFRRALELDPHHADAHANLAMVHYINARPHEAIAELKIAVQGQPDHQDALYTLGVILNEVGRRDEAIQAWRRTLQINPAHAEAQHELEKASSATATVEEPTDEVIRCPNCGGTILTAVSTCPHCDYELFIVCPRCKEYVPADSRLCPGCGYALEGLASDAGAESPRQRAEVHTRLGLAHLEDGRISEALREWQEAVAADPTHAAPHFYMGLLFVEQQQVAQAIDAFQQALRLDPDYAEAYLELGLIYLAQNKRQIARRAFEECLKHRPPVEVQREVQLHLDRLR